jgi:hypothetical protein
MEVVAARNTLIDAPPITTDDDFHFGVDVTWSVEYVP